MQHGLDFAAAYRVDSAEINTRLCFVSYFAFRKPVQLLIMLIGLLTCMTSYQRMRRLLITCITPLVSWTVLSLVFVLL